MLNDLEEEDDGAKGANAAYHRIGVSRLRDVCSRVEVEDAYRYL